MSNEKEAIQTNKMKYRVKYIFFEIREIKKLVAY